MSSTSAQQLKDYLCRIEPGGLDKIIEERRSDVVPEGGLEGARPTSSGLEKLATGKVLTPSEMYSLEAIIIPDKRPAIDIINGKFNITHKLWTHFSTDPNLRANIERAIKSIGRIELVNHPSLPYGGTGFVVGNGLLMTNRHVAAIFANGLGSRRLNFIPGLGAGIDFEREIGSSNPKSLTVRKVVMVHPYWDMALLSVDGLDSQHPMLSLSTVDLPTNRDIAVIGYPAFDPRNDSQVQNDVFHGVYGVKRLQPGKVGGRRSTASFGKTVSALTHDSSTLGGNSGSAVVDVGSGDVIALHFGGIYLDTNFAVPATELSRDGRVVAAGLNFSGRASGGEPPWNSYWKDADAGTDGEAEIIGQKQTHHLQSSTSTKHSSGEVRVTIPLEISVSLGSAMPVSSRAGLIVSPPDILAAVPETEAMVEPLHDSDYSNRKGYDAHFLDAEVPLPEPVDDEVLATMNGGENVIPYRNFSIAIHAKRRLALFTASNVTAEENLKKPDPNKKYTRKALTGLADKDQERWFIDPRLDEAVQLPDRFFTKDRGAFDKGHIVRREDVAWGKTYEQVRFANGDTYHVTNCSPQVAGFNRSASGEDNWGDLENFVLKQAGTEKLCLFAGPVLSKRDPVFVGVDDEGQTRVKIPTRFWKVVVANGQGGLETYPFLLEQDLSNVDTEFVVDNVWVRKMTSIAEIEKLTDIRFPKVVRKGDQYGKQNGNELCAAANIESGQPR